MNPAAAYAAFCAAHRTERLSIHGAAWEVIAAGSGPALLLLPGGFGVAATSFEYIGEFAAAYRVLALTYPPTLNRIAALADGAVAVLDHYRIAQAHILGGSASGAVAQVLVRRHPARVASLILAQTGPPQARRARLALRYARLCHSLPATLTLAGLRLAVLSFLPRTNAAHTFWRQHFAQVIAAQSRAGLAAKFEALADYDTHYRFTPSDLADWPGQVALIESSHDGFISAGEQAALRALYPHAGVHRLSGERHADSVSDSARQRNLLRTIMAKTR